MLSILLLMPASPFIHRIASRLPTLLFLIFAATLIYNLLAFPFSSKNRLKVFFRQDVDLETGLNRVSLSGLDGFIQKIVDEIPSAAGQHVKCGETESSHEGLKTCSWHGLAPNVVSTLTATWDDPVMPPEKGYAEWLSVEATRSNNSNANEHLGEATIKIFGVNTRACRLLFDSPILDFYVKGAAEEKKGDKSRVHEGGTKEIRLWSRIWDRQWIVHVQWNSTEDAEEDDMDGGANTKKENKSNGKGLDGTAVCMWSDVNERGVIPAFDEVSMYMPVWSIATKLDDGLVVGSKRFLV